MVLRLKQTVLCCFITAFCHAQQTESVHLHFDKDIYLPGETIWFKAYLYNGTTPARSTNFYAAIYDENGKLLQQKLYPVTEGTSNGDFTIQDTIRNNKIQFIAFTKGMIQADSNNVFRKTIRIYKKEDQLQDVTVPGKKINLEFFPEGGNWVAGVNNFIAFKAWYDDGSPAQVSGKIMDEETHIEIDSFITNKLGLGRLRIIPEQKTYTALWKDETGKTIKTALPPVNRYGIVMHAEQVKNNLYYIINKNSRGNNLRTLHLLAQRDNLEIYSADILIGDETILVNKFPLDLVPPGIVQLTLFDNEWKPLQERIVFINAGNKRPVVKEMKKSSLPKAKNIIELAMPDTLLTNLSASIADINFYDKTESNTIKQNLWFNSQLKGLNNNISDEIELGNAAEIDLVMLTHGWRKYSWDNIINNRPEKALVNDNYLSLDIDYKEKNYALPKNENLTLIINDKVGGKQFFILDPVSQTAFSQSGIVFYDSAKIYYKLKKNNEIIDKLSVHKSTDIKFPVAIDPVKPGANVQPFVTAEAKDIVNTIAASNLQKFNDFKTIKEVIVKGRYVNPITKRILQLDEKYTSGLFSGIGRGYQINVLDDENTWAGDIYNYIKYRIPTRLSIYGVTGNRKLYPCTMTGYDFCEPLVLFINEVESTGETLETVSLSDVAYIKFMPGVVVNSSGYTADGAVYVYTKKGDEEPSRASSMHSVSIKGYDLPKEFFNPDYSNKESLLQPDLRTTLYWNPYIITDKANDKIKIEYYNNDVSKKLLLTIEGINEAGELIHIEKIIE